MWHLFPIRVASNIRKNLFDYLRKNDVGVQVNYIPTILQPVFKRMGYSAIELPNTLEFYESEISLPIFTDLTKEEINRICSAIDDFFANISGQIH
jgi:dTDP-4-amino-4,6-dideoxygalactose transaminase